ncbi:MAG: acyl-CoA dehydrogenase family protein [Parvibaculales bacterium]
MDFSFSEDQAAFKQMVNKYLTDHYDFQKRRDVANSDMPYDTAFWQEAANMGWLTLPFSADRGGLACSPVDTVLFFEELGGTLVLEPFMETVFMTGRVLDKSASPKAQKLIDDIMDGTAQGALAVYEGNATYCPSPKATKLEQAGDGHVLSGTKSLVYNAPNADALIISAHDDSGETVLVLVDAKQAGVDMTTYPTIDGRQAAELTFTKVNISEQDILARGNAADLILKETQDEGILALCGEYLGGMKSTLEQTVEYAKQREQYGVAIGSFQALQHMMSDMFVLYELSKSLVYTAAIKLQEGADDADMMIAAAKVKTTENAREMSQHAIQLHGAIATTDEYSIGHYLKRIISTTDMFGSPSTHTKRFIAESRKAG